MNLNEIVKSKFLAAVLTTGLCIAGSSCAPEKMATVRLEFGANHRQAQVGPRAATTCSLSALWVAVRGPGMPRIRIPIVGATVDGISLDGPKNLISSVNITIPDQVINIPAGPARVISIIGRMDYADDTCVLNNESFPIYGQVGPVDLAGDSEGESLSITTTILGSAIVIDDADLNVGSPEKGYQSIMFDISAISGLTGCLGQKFRVFDTTVDGPTFRLTANLGSEIDGIADGVVDLSGGLLDIRGLLPARRYRIVIAADTCSGADSSRMIVLHYKSAPNANSSGTPDSAVCETVGASEAVCRRP